MACICYEGFLVADVALVTYKHQPRNICHTIQLFPLSTRLQLQYNKLQSKSILQNICSDPHAKKFWVDSHILASDHASRASHSPYLSQLIAAPAFSCTVPTAPLARLALISTLLALRAPERANWEGTPSIRWVEFRFLTRVIW